jgi:multiple antibiotic resistance protein
MNFLNDLLKAFIPMFVAVDIVGVLPFFIGVTEGIDPLSRKRLVKNSFITAVFVAVAFVLVGRALFDYLGIQMPDFMIAGGLVLFILSAHDLLSLDKTRVTPDATFGVVPLGTPLMSGPAVLATALILVKPYGLTVTIISIVLNMLIAGIAFLYSSLIIKILGKNGARALSKIMALVLCAYGVMMIRQGIVHIVNSLK